MNIRKTLNNGFSLKNIFLNEKGCRDIKTEKVQKQDWNGTLASKLNTTSTYM